MARGTENGKKKKKKKKTKTKKKKKKNNKKKKKKKKKTKKKKKKKKKLSRRSIHVAQQIERHQHFLSRLFLYIFFDISLSAPATSAAGYCSRGNRRWR